MIDQLTNTVKNYHQIYKSQIFGLKLGWTARPMRSVFIDKSRSFFQHNVVLLALTSFTEKLHLFFYFQKRFRPNLNFSVSAFFKLIFRFLFRIRAWTKNDVQRLFTTLFAGTSTAVQLIHAVTKPFKTIM